VERRLAAILAADAVGYSRMMREDEPGALALLQKHRAEVLDPAIAKHRGRIVKLMGDGLLAEFSSVVEGVSCAAEIQRAMAARNAGSPGHRQMAFRIGVHLGDVIVEDDDLYGDGVNVAARLEGIAQHGGICISRQAYDQVQKKVALGYRSLGPQNLKNIPEPIEVFAIQGDGLAMADERQDIHSFNELQRKTASAECAARYFEASGAIDVVALLPQIRVPTLVMHARSDRQVPFELGRQLATEIPGAKFVALQSSNHALLEQDQATQRFFEEISLFLAS
jgi:class 3 adenylate cyclase